MSTSVIVQPTKDTYLTQLLQQCEKQPLVTDRSMAGLLQSLRKRAAYQVLESCMPTKKDEEWRFTDLSLLVKVNFQLAGIGNITPNVEPFIIPEASHSRLVFVNGIYSHELSDVSAIGSGIYVGNLTDLPPEHQGRIKQYLGNFEEIDTFTALNTAGFRDVAIIWVSKNTVVEKPIHILYLSVGGENPGFSQPKTLVVAEPNSSLQLIEEYGEAENSPLPYFTNGVTEIWVQENARVNHTRIQRESQEGFHIGKSAILQSADSHYTCTEVNLGGKLSRHNLEVHQQGEQTETYLNGLTVVRGEQVGDTHSSVFLTKPHGIINQLHKCIVDDSARAVFNGKILVPQAAQMTNAAQLNRNLLLSPKGRVDTKPELQIIADDVKCSHGATVSQLEEDEVFYLRSRGLNEREARLLLVDAFAGEILGRIPVAFLGSMFHAEAQRRGEDYDLYC
ncbi:MAG: Fe-S cluster assembly protein SufD [Prochloron sp. SP5CPC1]|nr:Fe-S cluster assembly protein SufD [Candidatus Paraprochloron terpiosi SP5CPC1]